VPVMIAGGVTTLLSAFRAGDGNESLRLWSGVIGMTGIGVGMALAWSLSGLTRVYGIPQPVSPNNVAHAD